VRKGEDTHELGSAESEIRQHNVKKACENEALTNWKAQRVGQVIRTQKERREWGTHFLKSAGREQVRTSKEDREREKRASGRHSQTGEDRRPSQDMDRK
jgi:hypothetical protein